MRRMPGVDRLIKLVSGGLRARTDERNARRLARHLGCSMPDARRLYSLARERGYGAAYLAVFGMAPRVAVEVEPGEDFASEDARQR